MLGPWRNRPWLNAVASVIVSVLVLLSLILMTTTVFPDVDVTKVALIGGAVLAAGLSVFGLASCAALAARAAGHVPPRPRQARYRASSGRCLRWPCFADREWSTGRKVAMLALQAYLVVSVIILIVKAAQLAGA